LKDPQLNKFLEALCHPEFIAGDLLTEKKKSLETKMGWDIERGVE